MTDHRGNPSSLRKIQPHAAVQMMGNIHAMQGWLHHTTAALS